MAMTKARQVYLAGCLFDLRHLAGNAILGGHIERASQGRYSVYLPQDYEPESLDAKAIRDSDLRALLQSELAIFQFDGPELDSGTVVEFMTAKFADIPSVLVRTDFRKGGDRNEEPWNLMCSFYPRTEVLVADGIALYSQFDHLRVGAVKAAERAIEGLALKVVAKLDAAAAREPVATEGLSTRSALERLLGL